MVRELRRNAFVWVILIPVVIHFAVFQAIPIFSAIGISFFHWPILGAPVWAGLANYQELLGDEIFWKSLWNTTLFSLFYVVPTMASGLGLALLCNRKTPAAEVMKSVAFLPVVTSFVVLSIIWQWLFSPGENGVVNVILTSLGLRPQPFLASPAQALPVLAGLSIFKVAGNTMVYYLAGLGSIPRELYEAAQVDGATPSQTFWRVTLPLLKPTTFYVAVMTTIGSFQVFDSAFLITKGGPNYATNTLVYYIYTNAFQLLRMGYATAVAFVLFLIILGVSLLQRRYVGEGVESN